MKARAFSYRRVTTVEEAFEAFAACGDDALFIAGGQSLVPAMALRMHGPRLLIDIAHIAALRGIVLQDGWLRIGALTRHCEMLSDPLIAQHAPLLRAAAHHVAHPAIRNRGTIGGSIALADPAAEFPAMMLALGAELEIVGPDGSRRVAADDYFIELFQTALEPGELLVAAHIPLPDLRHCWAFDELARRRGDFAMVGCGIDGVVDDGRIERIRIAFFAVGNTPVRVRHAEAALIGAAFAPATIAAAQAALATDLTPPEDEQVPAAMRLHLARVLLGRLLGRLGAQ